mgnify:CR=1 FL=1
MSSCTKICIKCEREKPLVDYYISNKISNKCKECKLILEKTRRLYKQKLFIVTDCQCQDCVSGDLGKEKHLLRLRDDGIVVCLGCFRNKKRKGKFKKHRDAMCEYFKDELCMFCSRPFNLDLFEMIDIENNIISYSKYTHKVTKKNALVFLKHVKPKIACIKCSWDNITHYLR